MTRVEELAAEYLRNLPPVPLAVATIRGGETRFATFETTESALFEIGSVTKLFTALLVAEAVLEGRCQLDEPLSRFLPAGFRSPAYAGQAITLRTLLNHTSGLPRLPLDLYFGPYRTQPYRNYSRERLLRFFRWFVLQREPGATYLYSNLGYATLGEVLREIRGIPYSEQIRSWCDRHGLSDCGVAPQNEQTERHAQGHDVQGRPVEPWIFDAFDSAGAMRATLPEMAKFVRLALDAEPGSAMALTQAEVGTFSKTPPPGSGSWTLLAAALIVTFAAVLVPMTTSTVVPFAIVLGIWLFSSRVLAKGEARVGLGWHLLKSGGRGVLWHNGGTAGFRSFVGVCRENRTGVVVLAGSAKPVDSLGLQLLASLDAS